MKKFTPISSQINRGLVLTQKYKLQPQIYLHSISNLNTKVSFSKDPDSLHVGSVKTTTSTDLNKISINSYNFSPNSDFQKLLNDLFRSKTHQDIVYQLDALNYPSSYMPVPDLRSDLQYMNQRADLEDTFGFVHVNEIGEIVEGSYEENQVYRLCGFQGIITLSDFMLEELKKVI